MNRQNSRPSPEWLTGGLWNPVWTLRIFVSVALFTIALAMFVLKTGRWHDFCLGLSFGLLVGTLVQTFNISSIEMKEQERSDVDVLPITR